MSQTTQEALAIIMIIIGAVTGVGSAYLIHISKTANEQAESLGCCCGHPECNCTRKTIE
jgi:hypothetical protein